MVQWCVTLSLARYLTLVPSLVLVIVKIVRLGILVCFNVGALDPPTKM